MVLEFDASPVTWRTQPARVVQIVMTSPQLDRQMEAVAEDMRQTAEDVYISQEKGTGFGNTRQSFVTRRFRGGWAVVLSDWKAHWVESGAHAGGVTPVLGYRPMRTAMDRAERLSARLDSGRGPVMPPRVV